MSDSFRHQPSRQAILGSLSEGLLKSSCRIGLSTSALEIHHNAAPVFAPMFLHSASERFGVSLSLDKGRVLTPGQRLHCDTAELPFQDRVFSLVVLHHVIRDGKEPELSEAVRVLDRDGVLIVLGLNRLGWRYCFQGRIRNLPGMAPLKVKTQLDRMNMCMQGFAGAGLLGMRRPLFMSSGLAGLGSPFADVILLRARRNDGPKIAPLRFTERRSGIVQSAPLQG